MKEVTYKDWQKNPIPRMMWVWDDERKKKLKRKVIYFIDKANYPIIAVHEDGTAINYMHCAEIEEPKTRRMTNQELSWWLQDGKHREWKYGDKSNDNTVFANYSYCDSLGNKEVDKKVLIRENGGEWHEPLVEVEE